MFRTVCYPDPDPPGRDGWRVHPLRGAVRLHRPRLHGPSNQPLCLLVGFWNFAMFLPEILFVKFRNSSVKNLVNFGTKNPKDDIPNFSSFLETKFCEKFCPINAKVLHNVHTVGGHKRLEHPNQLIKLTKCYIRKISAYFHFINEKGFKPKLPFFFNAKH